MNAETFAPYVLPAPPPDSARVFSARAGVLLWAEWEGEGLHSVFDPGTGDTHLLNEFPAEILRQLGQGALAIPDLAQILARTCGVPCDSDWMDRVVSSVRSLWQTDLIDTAESEVLGLPLDWQVL